MELNKVRWSDDIKRITPKVKNLFYKGNFDLLLNDAPKLAVVGSRRMTDYGQRVIEKWMPLLVEKGVTIVSGFMYGVDQTAHKACIENGGKTIAVLGWGIDRKVAAEDADLYQKLVEVNSLIVSEYPGETKATRATFPQRNRIVAGVADAVLVVEAAEKSGSLITARLAERMGKKLLAIPGVVTSKVSEGTNNLIKHSKAVMVTSAEDILKEMSLTNGQMKMNFGSDSSDDPMMVMLGDEGKSIDELVRFMRIPVEDMTKKIFELEIDGLVVERNGKYFRN